MMSNHLLSRSLLPKYGIALASLATSSLAFGVEPLHCGCEYSLKVTAVAECLIDYPVINYTVEASGAHPGISIDFDGTVVATQPTGANNVITGFEIADNQTDGEVIVTATAVGPWQDGHAGGQTASTLVQLPPDCLPVSGRFTGGGNQVRVTGSEGEGIRVTRGLTLHCDMRLSNNLEINWTGGNKFHTDKNPTTIQCSDEPGYDAPPPEAPLDTMIGTGPGRLNGEEGFTVWFRIEDHGEKKKEDPDRMGILITRDSDGATMLTTDGAANGDTVPLNGGNLQAHFDQPHR